MNKMKNSDSDDEFRLTFDYFKINEELFEIYLKFSFKTHDILFNSVHDCLFLVDLKHVYFIINLHENDRHFFAFTISDMRQLQLTRMSQKSKSADFIMIEIVNRAFEKVFVQNEFNYEFSFLHFFNLFQFSNLCFYMNDFFEEQSADFFFLYRYLKNHFLFRIEWIKLKLFFKKLFLWQIFIKTLNIIHEINDKIWWGIFSKSRFQVFYDYCKWIDWFLKIIFYERRLLCKLLISTYIYEKCSLSEKKIFLSIVRFR